jgi:superfamily II DNA or RNA helicase
MVLSLDPDAVLRLRWDGVPTEQQVKLARSIPGAKQIAGGYCWGYWGETARIICSAFGLNGSDQARLGKARLGWAGHVEAWSREGWTWVDEDRLDQIEWRSRTELRPHQRAFKAWRRGAGRDGLFHPGCLLEAGLGLGKTLSAIEEILELIQHRPNAQTLVLTRNSLIETTWAQQFEQHAPWVPYILLNGKRAQRAALLLKQPEMGFACVWIHSHEDLLRASVAKQLAELDWDMIVIDETAAFRTASAQRTGRLTGYQAKPLTAPYRLGLSGLPMIKSAADLYPVLRWLGAPTGNKAQFLERFMAVNPRTHEVWLHDAEGLRSLLDCYRFQVPKSAVLSIPRAWHYERIQLKPWQRALYKKIQRQLQSVDPELLISSRLEELLRLAQVTAGFEGDRYRWDNAKLEHLIAKILPELDEEQAIIWVRFRSEALGVASRLINAGYNAGAYTGAQRDDVNRDVYRSFTAGHSQFFVSTLAKGALGLNLPMASAMVYLSRGLGDSEGWTQSLERNARLSTTHQALNVFVPEAEDSIDQKITQILGDDLHAAAQLTALDVREVLGR